MIRRVVGPIAAVAPVVVVLYLIVGTGRVETILGGPCHPDGHVAAYTPALDGSTPAVCAANTQ